MVKIAPEPTLFCDDPFDDLRPIDEIAEQVGVDVAKKIVKAYGGTRLYIPKIAKPDHPLAILIGFDNAAKLGIYFLGDRVVIPRRFNSMEYIRENAVKLYNKGWKVRDIALAMDCCERTVFAILRRKREYENPLLPMF